MFLVLISILENEEDVIFLTELYERYYPIMKRKAFDVSHDYAVVEDMVQESFVKLIDKISTLRSLEPNKLAPYLVHTTQNVTLNYIKQRKRTLNKTHIGINDDGVDLIADDQPTLEDMYSLKEDYQHIGEIISGLSERDQQLLYNKYMLELSDKEIAVTLDIKEANVRSYLTRARRRAMKLLIKKGMGTENEKTYG